MEWTNKGAHMSFETTSRSADHATPGKRWHSVRLAKRRGAAPQVNEARFDRELEEALKDAGRAEVAVSFKVRAAGCGSAAPAPRRLPWPTRARRCPKQLGRLTPRQKALTKRLQPQEQSASARGFS
eukprot:5811830-Pyramimonas_sp.AAC.1